MILCPINGNLAANPNTFNPKMKTKHEQIAEHILNKLDKQRFADWYDSRFIDYISDSKGPVSKQDVLEDIVNLFDIKSLAQIK